MKNVNRVRGWTFYYDPNIKPSKISHNSIKHPMEYFLEKYIDIDGDKLICNICGEEIFMKYNTSINKTQSKPYIRKWEQETNKINCNFCKKPFTIVDFDPTFIFVSARGRIRTWWLFYGNTGKHLINTHQLIPSDLPLPKFFLPMKEFSFSN